MEIQNEIRVHERVEAGLAPTPAPAASPQLDLGDIYCILQIDPNDSVVAMELARRLVDRGQHEQAVKVLRGVVRIDDRFETLAALGKAEYAADFLDDSFNHFQRALMAAPETGQELFDVLKTLGNIFVRRGDFESAEDSYHRAHRLNANSDDLQVNLGTLAIQRQHWDLAVDKFRQALQINPTNDKAWAGLAIGHRMKGDVELSWGNLEAALQYNPLNEVALTLSLDWGIQEKREFRVLEYLRNFLVAGGWNEKFSLAFAWLSYRRGDRLAASVELERLLAVNPAHEFGLSLAREMRGGK